MSSLVRKNMMYPSIFPSSLFNDFFQDIFSTERSFPNRGINHPCDIVAVYDDEKSIQQYEIKFALAGYNREDIEINVSGDNSVLTVSAKKSEMSENQDDKRVSLYSGIKRSSFSSSFRLEPDVDVSKIEAKMDNGSMVVVVPVDNNKKAKKMIEIQ